MTPIIDSFTITADLDWDRASDATKALIWANYGKAGYSHTAKMMATYFAKQHIAKRAQNKDPTVVSTNDIPSSLVYSSAHRQSLPVTPKNPWSQE